MHVWYVAMFEGPLWKSDEYLWKPDNALVVNCRSSAAENQNIQRPAAATKKRVHGQPWRNRAKQVGTGNRAFFWVFFFSESDESESAWLREFYVACTSCLRAGLNVSGWASRICQAAPSHHTRHMTAQMSQGPHMTLERLCIGHAGRRTYTKTRLLLFRSCGLSKLMLIVWRSRDMFLAWFRMAFSVCSTSEAGMLSASASITQKIPRQMCWHACLNC